MGDDQDSKKDIKKDLTGIFDLPKVDAPKTLDDNGFSVNESVPLEPIESFDSLSDLGMMDHTAPEEVASVEPAPVELAPAEDPFTPSDNTFFSTENVAEEPLPAEAAQEPTPALEAFVSIETPPLDAAPPMDFLDTLKEHQERSQAGAFHSGEQYPFTLLITGDFDPFARDKLLLFLNDNPVGTNSSELDLQIQGGRVLLPRISEYAGIKLVQDLRDSGLEFRLAPSPTDGDEVFKEAPSLRVQYRANEGAPTQDAIAILPADSLDLTTFKVVDSIQMVQFLRAEILEVERSELFQELLERMTQAMKKKAALKGAAAITHLSHKLTPLRLPSQYQIELSASLLKKIT